MSPFPSRAHTFLSIAGAAFLTACAATSQRPEQPAGPRTLTYDKSVFQSLLADHAKIRRVVTLTSTGVEAVTESDDPDVARRIKDHTLAMQRRMQTGSRVRAWDPVFVDLFDNHEQVSLRVTTTDKGVSITESASSPAVVALLHSHALGVSEFVRQGFESSDKETPRLTSPAAPRTIVSLGAFPHHFDRSQPDKEALLASQAAGVATVIDFRPPAEHPEFDERAETAELGLSYVSIPYHGDAELTDDVFLTTRKSLRSLQHPALLHCRSGNRVGAAWLPYRVLDTGASWEDALAEARAIGLKDPKLEAKAKSYIERNR